MSLLLVHSSTHAHTYEPHQRTCTHSLTGAGTLVLAVTVIPVNRYTHAPTHLRTTLTHSHRF